MRSLIFILFLLTAQIAHATVYVVYNDSTKEVLSISPVDDAVVPAGYSKKALDISIDQVRLDQSLSYYKFQNNRFVLDTNKAAIEEGRRADLQEAAAERRAVMSRALQMACADLEGSGTVFKHIKCSDL